MVCLWTDVVGAHLAVRPSVLFSTFIVRVKCIDSINGVQEFAPSCPAVNHAAAAPPLPSGVCDFIDYPIINTQ